MSNGDVIARPTPLWSDNPAAQDLLGFTDIAAPALEAPCRDVSAVLPSLRAFGLPPPRPE
jgi:hypothetical protein